MRGRWRQRRRQRQRRCRRREGCLCGNWVNTPQKWRLPCHDGVQRINQAEAGKWQVAGEGTGRKERRTRGTGTGTGGFCYINHKDKSSNWSTNTPTGSCVSLSLSICMRVSVCVCNRKCCKFRTRLVQHHVAAYTHAMPPHEASARDAQQQQQVNCVGSKCFHG